MSDPILPPITLDQNPIGSEHWKISKKKKEFDNELNTFYLTQIDLCKKIEESANRRSEEIFNSILYEVKWSNPTVSLIHGKLILSYCKHLIQKGSTIPFPNQADLKAWNLKCKATKREKISLKLKRMYIELYRIIEERDIQLNRIQNQLLLTGEKLRMQRDSTLRWMMEKNSSNQRERFFTIWDLVIRNKPRELAVLLKSQILKRVTEATSTISDISSYIQHLFDSDFLLSEVSNGSTYFYVEKKTIEFEIVAQVLSELINQKDPEFGLTPLHYAAKYNNIRVLMFLLTYGANPSMLGPDKRSPLHYAAAYAKRDLIHVLLSSGADSQQVDDYSCKPLDLARQNRNQDAIQVLLEWEKIAIDITAEIGRSVKQKPPPVSFLSGVPMDYQPCPGDIFHEMSRELKLLTTRLNGMNPYFTTGETNSETMESNCFRLSSSTFQDAGEAQNLTSENDRQLNLMVEVRLCSKHFVLCIQENLIHEGMKSLRRRWIAAKRLYHLALSRHLTNLEASLSAISSTICSPQISSTADHLELRETFDDSENKVAISDVSVDLEKLAVEFNRTATNITYHDIDPSIKSEKEEFQLPQITKISEKIFVEDETASGRKWNEKENQKNPEYLVQILEMYLEKERIQHLQDYATSTNNLINAAYYSALLSSKYSSTISFIDDNSVSLSSIDFSYYQPFSSFFERAARVPVNLSNSEKKQLFRNSPEIFLESQHCNYYISLGYDLVEVQLILKDYCNALLTLEECLSLRENCYSSSRIVFLLQKCDLLIYFFDHYSDYQIRLQEILKNHFFSQNAENLEELLDDPFKAHQLTEGFYDIKNFVNSKGEFVFHFNARSSSNSNVDLDLGSSNCSISSGMDANQNLMLSILRQLSSTEWLLSSCKAAAKEIIEISYALSRMFIIEPYSISLALFYLGKCEARFGSYLQAWKYMEEASMLSLRSREICFECIEMMLEVFVFIFPTRLKNIYC